MQAMASSAPAFLVSCRALVAMALEKPIPSNVLSIAASGAGLCEIREKGFIHHGCDEVGNEAVDSRACAILIWSLHFFPTKASSL